MSSMPTIQRGPAWRGAARTLLDTIFPLACVECRARELVVPGLPPCDRALAAANLRRLPPADRRGRATWLPLRRDHARLG